jgi:hypothetical protein
MLRIEFRTLPSIAISAIVAILVSPLESLTEIVLILSAVNIRLIPIRPAPVHVPGVIVESPAISFIVPALVISPLVTATDG